jgi:transposase
MQSIHLTDAQWAKMLAFLRTCPGIYIGSQGRCRKFLAAVVWVARSGAQWRLLPPAYGKWNSIYKRFANWSEKQVFEKLFAHCATDPDFEHLLLDSTVLRAHPCAAGAKKNTARKPSDAVKAAFRPSSI